MSVRVLLFSAATVLLPGYCCDPIIEFADAEQIYSRDCVRSKDLKSFVTLVLIHDQQNLTILEAAAV